MMIFKLIKKYNLFPPCFIYDSELIKRQFLKLKNLLPKNFEIFYSVKANPNNHILKIFKNLKAGVEISSGGELTSVLKADFLPGKIIFTGPGKNDEELKAALSKKIYLIIVESINEIERIEEIARKINIKQNLLLRINPSFSIKGFFSLIPMMGGGSGQKFGIEEKEMPKILNRVRNFKNINLMGLHFFLGSNIFDEKSIIHNTAYLFQITEMLEREFKIYFPIIDIGGGLAINYSSDYRKKFDIRNLCHGLRTLVEKYKFNKRKIILESGRFLIGEAGQYVVRVVDKKKLHKEKFVIIDGGKNHISMATLSTKNHRIEILNRKKSGPKEVVNIVGNLNTPIDFITKANLPKIEIGDLLSIKNTGAYGLSSSLLFFSNHPIPKEYLFLKNGQLKIISKEIKYPW